MRLIKKGDEITLLDNHGKVCPGYLKIKSVAGDIPQDFTIGGEIYCNQFLVAELLLYGDIPLSDEARVWTLDLMANQYGWNDTNSVLCLLDTKLLCKDCNKFPCACSEKRRKDKTVSIPLDLLSLEQKMQLAEELQSLSPDLANTLWVDKDIEIRKAVYRHTDREVIMNTAIANCTKFLANTQKGSVSEIEEVLELCQNRHVSSFLLRRLLVDIIGYDTETMDAFRSYVLYIIQNPCVDQYTLDTLYGMFSLSLTVPEQIALLSSLLSDDNKELLIDNISDARKPIFKHSMFDKIRELEQDYKPTYGSAPENNWVKDPNTLDYNHSDYIQKINFSPNKEFDE